MRQVGKGKPLTGSYSFETNCTFDEPSQRAIQVNVIQPKRKGSTEKSFDDRLFLSQDNGYVASETVRRQRPAPVTAYFPQKREASRQHAIEGSFGRQTKTQNQPQIKVKDKKVQQNSSKLSKTIEIAANDTNLKDKQKNAAPKDRIIQIAEQLQSNSRRKGSRSDSVQIDFSQDESMRNLNESLLIDIDESQISDPLSHTPPTAKFILPQIPINAALENRQSRVASIQSQRDRSNSKMKLRDYLYMVEATSKQSSLQKRQQASLTKQKPQVKVVEKVEKEKQEGRVMTERSTLSTKKEYGMMKYSVSNGKMLDILKKQIHQDISQVETNLRKIDQEIKDFTVAGGTQPTNEQLLILYGIRRQVKQEISKRLEMAMQAINEHKKALASSGNPHSLKQLFLSRNQH